MDNTLSAASIIEKQKKRYALLLRIYELTNGDESEIITLEDSLTSRELQSTIAYLAGEGLVSSHTNEAPLVSITHKGVMEVEQSLLKPDQATEHFASVVIQNFNANVGSVQTGDGNIAHVSLYSSVDPEVIKHLKDLRKHITDESDQRAEALELLDGLEAEISSEVQSQSRIKLFLRELGSFTKETGKELILKLGTILITDGFGL